MAISPFYKKPISYRSVYYKNVLQLLKYYKVRGYFHYYNGNREAVPAESRINVGLRNEDGKKCNDTIQSFLSGVCHELAHVLNYRNKKYYDYHNFHMNTRYTKKRVQNWIRVGYKAERYTDKVGQELMRKHFPGIPYLKAYTKKDGHKWYKENYLKDLYEFMRGERTFND